jgi:hypothetical protein
MQILTTQGYQDINDVEIGSPIIGKGGETNILLDKRTFDKTWFEEQNILDEWKWYLINGTYKFCGNQNIYVTSGGYNLCHVSELQVGWKIVDLNGNDIEIVSIVETSEESIFWKLDVSNDHSFITQDIEVHNASRYWVGGGSSANWNATGNTNWSATSGGSNNASVPGVTDDVTFNGVGATANTNSTISAIITVLSFTSTAGYTATITRSATLGVAGNVTIHKNTVWASTGGMSISAASTITANGFSAGDTFWNQAMTFVGFNTKTLVSASNDIKITGNLTLLSTSIINRTTNETLTLSNFNLGNSVSGTAKIVLVGGTWSGSFAVSNNLDLAGNITIGTVVSYNTGTLTYVSGTIDTSTNSTTLNLASCTINTPSTNVTWYNITIGLGTYTLSANLANSNLLTLSTVSGNSVINGFSISSAGSISIPNITIGTITGTTNLKLTGTGTFSMNPSISTGYLALPVEIAAGAGTVTFGSTLKFLGGNLTYTSGTVNATTNGNTITGSTTFTINAAGLTLNNITATGTTTFAGSQGCTIAGTYQCTTAGITHTFASTKTYAIATLILYGTSANRNVLKSSTGGSQAIINLTNISSDYYLNVTDINGSGGVEGWTFNGVLSNTSNWNSSSILYWVGSGVNWASNTSWSPYSGGIAINIASLQPASSENAAFDSNSTGNCTIAATATCNNLDMTGYSAARTWTVNATLTSAGNITFQNQFTITTAAGTPTLAKTTGGTITVGAGGFNWPHNMSFVGAITYTLVGGDLTIGSTLSALTSGNATINGVGLTINVKSVTATAANLAGTAKIKFITSGGVWTGQIISDNVEIAIPATVTPDLTWTSAIKYAGTLTYVSGNMGVQSFTVISTVSFVNISAITFNTLTVGQTSVTTTFTADGDITATTFACIAFNVASGITLASSTGLSYAVYCSSITYTGEIFSTSQKYSIIMNGTGTITPSSTASTNVFNIALTINTTGTITIQVGPIFLLQAITYIKGNIIANYTGGPSLSILNAATTIDTNYFEWFAVTFTFQNSNFDHILLSDLRVKNLTITNLANIGTARFRNSGGDIYVSNDLTLASSNFGLILTQPLSGTTATINMIGTGVISWAGAMASSQSRYGFDIPLIINTGGKYLIKSTLQDTNLSFSNTFIKSGIFTYIKGRVEVDPDTALLIINAPGISPTSATSASTLTNIHRIPWKNVSIFGGATMTMNEFFCGKPGRYCNVRSTSTTNAIITFTDGFEKFSRFCLPTNMTVTQRGQVKLLNSKGNRNNTNLGFTYFEGAQPYGIPKNDPIVYTPSPCYGISDGPADPLFF